MSSFVDSVKARQSSSGKSFFSRAKLHKDKQADKRAGADEGALNPETASVGGSVGSRTSRHTHRSSIASKLDFDRSGSPEPDQSGLAMTTGVITAIPYDSVSPDGRTPIPVDYLPRADQNAARREPLPHHLNKGGGDFHQYPAVSQSAQPGAQQQQQLGSQLLGPRPRPGSSAGSFGERTSSLPQNGNGGAVNGHHGGNSSSFSTADSSSVRRKSLDQASVHSSISSATRESSIFTSSNSSHTAIPQAQGDTLTLVPSASRFSSPSKQAHSQSSLFSHHPSAFGSTSSVHHEALSLNHPPEDRVIEEQFLALMQKRGSQNLPEQARMQMLAYPLAKKWTLVYQDKLTEWQSEQRRKTNARQTIVGPDGQLTPLGRADEEGSPEWYVRKVMDDSISAKQLSSLSVSLRTQPIR